MKQLILLTLSLFSITVASTQKCNYRINDFQFWYDVLPQLEGYENHKNVKITIVGNTEFFTYGQENQANSKQFDIYNSSPSVFDFTTGLNATQLHISIIEKSKNTRKDITKSHDNVAQLYRYGYMIKTDRVYKLCITDPAKNNDTIFQSEVPTSGSNQWPTGALENTGYVSESALAEAYKNATSKIPEFDRNIEKNLIVSCMNANLLKILHHSLHPGLERIQFIYNIIKTKDPAYSELAVAFEHIAKADELLKIHNKAKTIPGFYQQDVKTEMQAAYAILKKYYEQLDVTKATKTEDELTFEMELSGSLYLTAFNVGDYSLCEQLYARVKTAYEKEPPPKFNKLLGMTEAVIPSSANKVLISMNGVRYYVEREKLFGKELRQRYNY
jgi:hypothetical protein